MMKRMIALAVLPLVLAAAAWGQPAPAAPNAPTDTHYHARVESLEKTKVILTRINQGDSIDKPTGKRAELVIDAQTKFLNIRAQEIGDEELKQKMLGKGQVVDVTTEEKDGKTRVVKLQAIGG